VWGIPVAFQSRLEHAQKKRSSLKNRLIYGQLFFQKGKEKTVHTFSARPLSLVNFLSTETISLYDRSYQFTIET